ncbi:MAG: helix-turn-helix transcriptional regulator [Planctomycetota bacterium]
MATKAQHGKHYRHVPELLRTLREEAALTQRELGDAVGRPQSWVHNCETGNRRVDIGELRMWCDACSVDLVKTIRRYLKLHG